MSQFLHSVFTPPPPHIPVKISLLFELQVSEKGQKCMCADGAKGSASCTADKKKTMHMMTG